MLPKVIFSSILFLLFAPAFFFPAHASRKKPPAKNTTITIDGRYDDWKLLDQPESITDHSYNGKARHTAGIYMDDTAIYVHLKLHPLYSSHMPVDSYHLTINNKHDVSFMLRYGKEQSGIDWGQNVYALPVGIHTLGVFHTQTGRYLGEAKVTISTLDYIHSGSEQGKFPPDEWELSIPLKNLSEITGLDAAMIQSVSFSGDNIGQGSVSFAGTPTGFSFFFLVLLLIILYFLSVCKRAKLYFLYFALGSLLLFSILHYFLAPVFLPVMTNAILKSCNLLLSSFDVTYRKDYAMLLFPLKDGALSLTINEECAGILELFILVSLLWFFPVYRIKEKLLLTVVSTVYLFFCNVLRILILCLLLQNYGMNIYFMAHSVITRILFYSLCILLYFAIFTRAHILRQKVGRFSYDNS